MHSHYERNHYFATSVLWRCRDTVTLEACGSVGRSKRVEIDRVVAKAEPYVYRPLWDAVDPTPLGWQQSKQRLRGARDVTTRGLIPRING